MKILLTGARGMLGQRLATTLAAAGHEVVATARAPAPGVAALDVTEHEAVRTAVRAVRPEWIVNAAAYTQVDRAESEEELARRVNEDGPAHLAEAAAAASARLLHFSTDFVFDGAKADPYEEDDPVGPLGAYARTKEAGERAVRARLEDHLILRVSWLFGPGGRNFVDTIRRLAAERDRLRVVDDQRGTPTFTGDVADLVRRLLGAGLRGTVHGAGQGVTTWCGLAREVLRQTGSATPVDPIPTEAYPTPARRPANSALRNRVLERTIGDSMRPWTAALRDHLRSG